MVKKKETVLNFSVIFDYYPISIHMTTWLSFSSTVFENFENTDKMGVCVQDEFHAYTE